MSVKIQLRRETSSQWSSANPVLANGELVVETDTRKIKIGDGISVWNSLAYAGTPGAPGVPGTSAALTGALSYMPHYSAPFGWLPCNGTELSASYYPELANILPSSINTIQAPASISTDGFSVQWVPTLQLFDYGESTSYPSYGAYLSQPTNSGTLIDAFSVTFNHPVSLAAVTMLNTGYGTAPTQWSIRTPEGQVVAEGIGAFENIGGRYTTGYNWYNFTTSITAQTYIISVRHDSGYSTDIGVARMAFRTVQNASSGYALLPQLPSIVTSYNLTLFPYIKT